uniref:Uncharacterized protein n=1 Tax=Kalanchoe fedtschenkoi TaxID=63787 RepID=A0A7N0RFH0_KALFE
MVLLEKLWDDLVDRSESSCRLAGLRRITTPPLVMADARGGNKFKRPGCSATAVTPTAPVCKDSVWDSMFYPEVENHHHLQAAKPAGADLLRKAQSTACNGVYSEGANSSKSPLLA